MAQKRKTGLSSVAFDIDFLSHPAVVCLKGEFGAKGIAFLVTLLLVMGRTGYYLEWNDVNRRALAVEFKSMGVSVAFIDQMVRCLVKWGLFDRALFDEAGVLTSAEIQERYFGQTRRRRGEECLPYVLVERRTSPSSEPQSEPQPTLEQVRECFRANRAAERLSDWEYEAAQFFSYYDGLGWRTGSGAPIRRWQSFVISWVARKEEEQRRKPWPPLSSPQPDRYARQRGAPAAVWDASEPFNCIL